MVMPLTKKKEETCASGETACIFYLTYETRQGVGSYLANLYANLYRAPLGPLALQ